MVLFELFVSFLRFLLKKAQRSLPKNKHVNLMIDALEIKLSISFIFQRISILQMVVSSDAQMLQI